LTDGSIQSGNLPVAIGLNSLIGLVAAEALSRFPRAFPNSFSECETIVVLQAIISYLSTSMGCVIQIAAINVPKSCFESDHSKVLQVTIQNFVVLPGSEVCASTASVPRYCGNNCNTLDVLPKLSKRVQNLRSDVKRYAIYLHSARGTSPRRAACLASRICHELKGNGKMIDELKCSADNAN
jgi:hypothetical protein